LSAILLVACSRQVDFVYFNLSGHEITVDGVSGLPGLETWLDKGVKGRKRESQSGAAKEAHDEAGAERFLARGMKLLGLTSQALGAMPKGALEKIALAWWLRRSTTVPLVWVSDRLQMGHYTRVTQAISRVNRKPGRKLKPLRDRLLKLNQTDV